MSGNDQDARITAVLGSSGSGKSTWTRVQLNKKKRRRTFIWSPKEPIDNYAAFYSGTIICTTGGEVLEVLRKAGPKGEFHIVFVPRLIRAIDKDLFHDCCMMLLAVRNVTAVMEELHTVTQPNWAPDGWRKLVMMGRGYGVEIFGLSQRPASMDKDFLGNTSLVHVGRLSLPADAKAVAAGIGVKPAEISYLNGYEWIERNTLTGIITKSKK